MRVFTLVLLASFVLSCKTGVAVTSDGFCAQWALFDIRVGLTYCSAGSAELEHSKDPGSKAFFAMTEEILPDMVEAGIKAAMACATSGASEAIPSLVQACDIAEALKPAEGKRRTPEEKAANREERARDRSPGPP